jgi:hypothetical protein
MDASVIAYLRYHVDAGASLGPVPLFISNVVATSPEGDEVPVQGSDGTLVASLTGGGAPGDGVQTVMGCSCEGVPGAGGSLLALLAWLAPRAARRRGRVVARRAA